MSEYKPFKQVVDIAYYEDEQGQDLIELEHDCLCFECDAAEPCWGEVVVAGEEGWGIDVVMAGEEGWGIDDWYVCQGHQTKGCYVPKPEETQ